MFKKVWKEEKIPTRWTKTTLLQLYKMKGDFQELKNLRNIHLKDTTVKVFSKIVVNTTKQILMKNMSPFQIGTKKGHRASEHIYVLKSVMQLYAAQSKPLITSYFDYATFFDSESISDVMHEVYRAGVRGKAYRLLYRLNERTAIRVSTPVGLTAEAIVDEIVGQGTVEGAVVSAVSIGEGVEEYFRDSPYELWYYDIGLQPAVFMDGVARCAAGRREAQVGNNLIESVTESKQLTLNHDKRHTWYWALRR